MDRNQRLLSRLRSKPWLLPSGFATLSLLSAASIVLAFLSGLDRLEAGWIFNLGVDILGLLMCAVLYYGCMKSEDRGEETTYLFVALLSTNGFSLFLDECAWLVQGVPSLRIWNLIINILFYANGIILLYQFWRYIRSALALNGEQVRRASYALQIALIPAVLMCWINLFVPVYFSVDAMGVYRREALYPLGFAYGLFWFCVLVLALLRSNAPRRQKAVVVSFVTLPILNAIITFGTFGISTQYVATLVSIVLIYSVLFSERSRSLAATQTELHTATRIQEAMLPNIFPPFPERSEFDLYASMDPAKEVGGDFYDFFLVDDDHLGIVMADVSGKGVPAALFMMASKILLQTSAMLGGAPAEILTKTNETICANNQAEMFVTVWLGILEISTGKLTAANAGHEYPVLQSASGGQFDLLKDKHGFVIGGMPGMKYREYELQLKPGTKLFLYTDGVPEATDAGGNMFGTDRMLAALNEKTDCAPAQVLHHVRACVDDFVKDAEQFDDLTMLCLEYKGTASKQDEIDLEAAVEQLPQVQAFVEQHLQAADCPQKTRMQIGVAVEEIFINIASYAYAPETGRVTVGMEVTDHPASVRITFADCGIPYNPLSKGDPDVTLTAEERGIGGLGIYMTKKIMDDVAYDYCDGKNILTLKKNL